MALGHRLDKKKMSVHHSIALPDTSAEFIHHGPFCEVLSGVPETSSHLIPQSEAEG